MMPSSPWHQQSQRGGISAALRANPPMTSAGKAGGRWKNEAAADMIHISKCVLQLWMSQKRRNTPPPSVANPPTTSACLWL